MDYQNPIPKLLKNPIRLAATARLALHWLKAYFSTQERIKDAEFTVVETEVDERIAPEGRDVYPYLFACVYILYVAWTMLDRLSGPYYRRSKAAFRFTIEEAQRVFVASPTRMANRERSDHPLLQFTQYIDGPTNCFPSLHVGLVSLSYQILKDNLDLDPLLLAAMRSSVVDICRSTMKTKQHSVVDVLGGLELSRRAFTGHFDSDHEDLVDDVLRELSVDERREARALCAESEDLTALLPDLLRLFHR